jgi:hypothetical protein
LRKLLLHDHEIKKIQVATSEKGLSCIPLKIYFLKGRVKVELGIGRGKRAVSRVIEWLRKADQKVAWLTNGYQWRLIHAGADYDAWCEWDINLWFEEGRPGPQVTALRLLLGEASLRPEKAEVPSPLMAATLDV